MRLNLLPTAFCLLSLEPHLLSRNFLLALHAFRCTVIHVGIKVDQRLDRDTFNCARCGSEPHDRSTADDSRSQRLHERHGFLDSVAAANNVIDNNAGIDLPLVDVLAKHSLTLFLFRPVDLFRTQSIAYTKSYGYSS